MAASGHGRLDPRQVMAREEFQQMREGLQRMLEGRCPEPARRSRRRADVNGERMTAAKAASVAASAFASGVGVTLCTLYILWAYDSPALRQAPGRAADAVGAFAARLAGGATPANASEVPPAAALRQATPLSEADALLETLGYAVDVGANASAHTRAAAAEFAAAHGLKDANIDEAFLALLRAEAAGTRVE